MTKQFEELFENLLTKICSDDEVKIIKKHLGSMEDRTYILQVNNYLLAKLILKLK